MTTDWTDINEICTSGNLNLAYEEFLNRFSNLYQKCFPISKIKNSKRNMPKNEWITPALIKSCHKKSKLYREYKGSPTLPNRTKFITYRNKLKSLLSVAEINYYSNLFLSCEHDLKRTWTHIKTLLHGYS
jgi:hypothetical protein